MSENKNQGRPVLVTTAHRGVFFGYLVGEITKEKVTLDKMRNILRWDEATKGFIGLASTGPTDGCRVGPAAGAESTLFDITGVFGCTEAAVARWESGPWAR
jgi:hypothetical protein